MIDLILSGVVAASAACQAVVVVLLFMVGRKQNRIANAQLDFQKDIDKRQRLLEAPRFRFVLTSSLDHVGFTATNESLLPIIISRAGYDVAVPIREGDMSISSRGVHSVVQLAGCEVHMPQRLGRGEAITVISSREEVQRANMIRPMCADTLGNRYYANFWIDYSENSKDVVRSGLASGFRSVEEWLAGDRIAVDAQGNRGPKSDRRRGPAEEAQPP